MNTTKVVNNVLVYVPTCSNCLNIISHKLTMSRDIESYCSEVCYKSKQETANANR